MTALAAHVQRRQMGDEISLNPYRIKDDAIIFNGGMVSLTSTGLAVAASDAASQKFAGIAYRGGIDNTNGGDGVQTSPLVNARNVDVVTVGRWSFAVNGATPVARNTALIYDDNTVSADATSNNVKCGVFVCPDTLTPGNWFVDIEPAKIAA